MRRSYGRLVGSRGREAGLAPDRNAGSRGRVACVHVPDRDDYSWELTPTGSQPGSAGSPWSARTSPGRAEASGTVLRTTNARPNVAVRRAARHGDAAVPRHRGLRRRQRRHPLDRHRHGLADLRDLGRRPHLALDFMNDEPTAFYDCMTFFDRQHGLALSDPVDGRFRILETSDGGRSWEHRPRRHAAGSPGRVRLRRERAVHHLGGQARRLVRHGRRRERTRVPLAATAARRGGQLNTPDAQRPLRRDLRARVPRHAARAGHRRRLPRPDGVAGRDGAQRRRRAAGSSLTTLRTSTAPARTGSQGQPRSPSAPAAAT